MCYAITWLCKWNIWTQCFISQSGLIKADLVVFFFFLLCFLPWAFFHKCCSLSCSAPSSASTRSGWGHGHREGWCYSGWRWGWLLLRSLLGGGARCWATAPSRSPASPGKSHRRWLCMYSEHGLLVMGCSDTDNVVTQICCRKPHVHMKMHQHYLKKSVKSICRCLSKHHLEKKINETEQQTTWMRRVWGFVCTLLFAGSTFPSRARSFNGLCNISTVLYALLYPQEGHTERGW